VQSLSQIVERAVQVEGARIQSIAGDGVMVVFGAPAALEDAPLRACRAAQSILASLKAAGPEIERKHGAQPEVRIGINAGPAVFGHLNAGGDAGLVVLGDVVNIAARARRCARFPAPTALRFQATAPGPLTNRNTKSRL
jgi:class 3 adenylate cyclase